MLLNQTIESLRENGFLETLVKIVAYPVRHSLYLLKKRRFKTFFKNLLTLQSVEDRFTWIYRSHYWGSESLSGPGSTIEYTKNLRQELPKLITTFNVKSIFDAPCGDFNWMKMLLPKLDVTYIGADIVKELIGSHQANYESKAIKFIELNIITDRFPKADW